MGISREVWDLRDSTPPNKENPFQTRKNTNKQGKHLSINKKNTFQARKRLSSKGYLPIKCKSLQVVGISGQGKAVVSDGGSILFIGMGRCGGNQGKREAAMAWGRPRWSSVPVPLWR